MDSFKSLPRPFFVLAPMDDVTDTVLRQIIADCAPPDLFFTEFVNVDGLQSRGRPRLMHKLSFTPKEQPLIAQIWGKTPANYEKVADELVEMGFAGVDINMGCPDKSVVKNGCCSALINNRELAVEIIASVKRGVAGRVPVSVKLRTGFNQVDFSWPELILQQGIDMLTVHGRTTKEMSKVPARWEDIKTIREIRDKVAPQTLIVGNGDVMSREHGERLAAETGVDGVMIGRAIFTDPYIFAKNSSWADTPEHEKLVMYKNYIELFLKTYPPEQRIRNWESLKRMAKIYVHGVEHASQLRDRLVRSTTPQTMLDTIDSYLSYE
ncbi:MAG: tRNA-dihydrouridine synthase [Candidatus Saccharimonadales bacterium]